MWENSGSLAPMRQSPRDETSIHQSPGDMTHAVQSYKGSSTGLQNHTTSEDTSQAL